MTRQTRLIPWSLALLLASTAATAREEAESSPESTRAYREGYNLILNGEWDAARAAFEELIGAHPDSGWVDDAKFWLCYAGAQARQPAATVFACYEDLIESYPRSEWKDDAKRAMVRLAGQLDRDGQAQYRSRVADFGRGEDDRELLQVLVALGEIGDERSIDVILERLDATEDEHLRERIVDVLDDIDSPRVAAKLTDLAVSDPAERVRVAAVEAIGDHESADGTALLRRIALDRNQPTRVRTAALDELGEYESANLIELFAELVSDPDPDVADEAIDELGDAGTRDSLAALTRLLAEIPDADRRLTIVDRIEDFESDAAVQALLAVAGNDPDPRIRRAATESLGDMETAAAREALIQLLRSMGEGP